MRQAHWYLACLWLAFVPAQAQTLQAVTEDAPPYTYIEHGKVAGPATEVVQQTLQRAGLNDYRLHLYPWARAYDLALAEGRSISEPSQDQPRHDGRNALASFRDRELD